ncbi:hypothetical protein V2J09_023802 [Rumex salicifolius]
MSVATELQSPSKPVHEARKILGPGGNRARVPEPAKAGPLVKPKKPNAVEKKAAKAVVSTRPVPKMPDAVVRKNASLDSSCSAESSSSSSSSSLSAGSAKTASSSRRARLTRGGLVSVKATPVASGSAAKRCDWITANSGSHRLQKTDFIYPDGFGFGLLDPLHISFHDKEWGIPVRDDSKLYELLVLSIALAEHTWVSILSKRDRFRSHFDKFDVSSVAKFSEEKLVSLCTDRNALLSEPKLRAIVENARQILKVQEEFGSFNNYCWRFLNNQPIRNGHRYARQVPVKTPKAEFISKDLIRRGFRCVGPTVVYSFMQVSGMVNDHLISCFRYNDCNAKPKEDTKQQAVEKEETLTQEMERTSTFHG